jgi:hypothetical protein
MLHEVPYKIMNSEWVHSINTYWTFIKMSDQMCRVRTQNVSHIWFKGQFRNFLAWGCCAAWKRLYICIRANWAKLLTTIWADWCWNFVGIASWYLLFLQNGQLSSKHQASPHSQSTTPRRILKMALVNVFATLSSIFQKRVMLVPCNVVAYTTLN